MELLVPAPSGAHSTAGRASNRGMDKLRAVAHELIAEAKKTQEAQKAVAERIAAERAERSSAAGGSKDVSTKAPVAAPPAQQEEDAPPPPKKRGPKPGASPQDKKSTPMGRAVRERLGLPGPATSPGAAAQALDLQSPGGATLLGLDDGGEPASPTNEDKPTIAFTSQGADDAKLSENTRVNLKRFFFTGSQPDRFPEVGHYRVQENLLKQRVKVMDFGYREKHPTRKVDEFVDTSRELGPDDLTTLDFRWHSSGSMFASPSQFSIVTPSRSMDSLASSRKEQSLMSQTVPRPDLHKSNGARISLKGVVTMNEVSEPNQPEEQDRKTSAVRRAPETNLTKQLGRKNNIGDQFPFFEAAKYKPQHNVVLPVCKKHIGFHQQMSRSSPVVSQKPPGLLDEKGTSYHPDRSVYRHHPISKPRVTHVREMEKDLHRPPLCKPAPVHHDESDPEVDRAVHERAMTIDANTLDRAMQPRRDVAPKMHHSLPRDRAGHGSRIAQEDIAHRAKHGHIMKETTGCLERSVAQLKDSIRLRPDVGVTFDQSKARGRTRLKGAYSSLHRPRGHAPPDFSRSAPLVGFSPSTPVKVMHRTRSHEAMPGWSAEAADGLMDM